ncbi:MAG: ATP-dependent Clp protease proteolytic subunit [Bacteroidota bacterium]
MTRLWCRQVSDMAITYQLFTDLQKELYNILSLHTGQDYQKVAEDCDRDTWMRSDEAKAYGLVDEVLRRDEVAS